MEHHAVHCEWFANDVVQVAARMRRNASKSVRRRATVPDGCNCRRHARAADVDPTLAVPQSSTPMANAKATCRELLEVEIEPSGRGRAIESFVEVLPVEELQKAFCLSQHTVVSACRGDLSKIVVQTRILWHHVADQLEEHFTRCMQVVIACGRRHQGHVELGLGIL